MRFKNYLLFTCIVLFYISITNKELKAQSSVSVGFGIPEYINAGYRYHKEQMGFGLSIGVLPTSNENIFTGRVGFLYHFYGKRKYSLIKPWYFNSGFSYCRYENKLFLDNLLLFDFRLGREFSLNHSWGIFTEIGVVSMLLEKTYYKTMGVISEFNNNTIPSIGLGLYYRFPEACHCPKPRKH